MKLYIINPTKGRKLKLGGPNMAKRKRRKASRTRSVSKRKYRRNPGGRGLLKQAFNRKHIVNIASLGIGFVGGIKAQKYINQLDALVSYRRFTGLIPFILGTIIGVKGRREAIKSIGAGLSLSGLYDLVTQNVPQIGLSPVEGVDLDDDMYTGTAIDLDGQVIDVDGDDDETIVVGENDYDEIDVVGESEGSPYAMV